MCLCMVLFMFVKGGTRKENKIWGIACLFAAIWEVGAIGFSTTSSKNTAFFWWQIAHIGIIVTPAVYFHFVYAYLKLSKKWLLSLVYILVGAFLVCNFFWKELFIGDLRFAFNQFYVVDWPKYHNIVYFVFYVLFYWVLLGYAFLLLLFAYTKSSGLKHNQIKFFIIGSIVAWLGPEGIWLSFLGFNVYPYSNVLVGIFPFVIGYAIVRHQLMSIEIIIKKTLVFAGLLASVSAVLILPTLLIQGYIFRGAGFGGRILGLTISGIIIIVSLRRIENFLINVTDKFLFQKKYDYRQVLKSFIDEVITVLDLDTVIQKTSELLDKMFHPESSIILLLDNDKNKYVSYGNKDMVLERALGIPRYLKSSTNILSAEDKGTNEELRNEMNKLNARLAMPLLFRDELIGIMLLGKKKSDKIYTKEDLDILTDLAQTEATVVSNSRTHTLLLQAREKEQQAEHLVSLGFVVTNISHELRNPIHIISGAAETALDAIDTELDITKLDENNHKTVEYVKTKLKSIMERSNKTHEMLESILHAIKINPANFVDLSLQKTVNEAISRLESHLKSAGINIANGIPGAFPLIKADSIAIEQVFVNLLTNAIHAIEYSKKGDRIQIEASDLDDNVRIEISDNGPGIAEQDIKRIFEPFYTTKDNLYAYKKGRSEGSGLGLMIVYQTIKKHNGTIGVRSEEGRGTTFVIELPKT